MEAEILDFRILKNRQVANFNIGGRSIAFHLAGHIFGLIGKLAPPGIFILTLQFPLAAQHPAGDKERHHADCQRHNGGKNKCRPQLLTAPDSIFIGKNLFRIIFQRLSVIANRIDRLRANNIAHRRQCRTPPVNAAVHKGLPAETVHQHQPT